MKVEYIKIFSLLIALFYINILEINNLRRANKNQDYAKNEDDYIRLLDSIRTEDDKESIKNCEDSSDNYYSYYTKGIEFKFDKYVDERDAVINNYYNILILILYSSHLLIFLKKKKRKEVNQHISSILEHFLFLLELLDYL